MGALCLLYICVCGVPQGGRGFTLSYVLNTNLRISSLLYMQYVTQTETYALKVIVPPPCAHNSNTASVIGDRGSSMKSKN